MNGKIILTLFILFYHKEEVKSKKLLKNDDFFQNEDLIVYINEPNYRVKRQLDLSLETISGQPEESTTLYYNESITTDQTSLESITSIVTNLETTSTEASSISTEGRIVTDTSTTTTTVEATTETTCNEGYTKNVVNNLCEDINECQNVSICAENAICVNKLGSYECKCIDGYERINSACIPITTINDLTSESTTTTTIILSETSTSTTTSSSTLSTTDIETTTTSSDTTTTTTTDNIPITTTISDTSTTTSSTESSSTSSTTEVDTTTTSSDTTTTSSDTTTTSSDTTTTTTTDNIPITTTTSDTSTTTSSTESSSTSSTTEVDTTTTSSDTTTTSSDTTTTTTTDNIPITTTTSDTSTTTSSTESSSTSSTTAVDTTTTSSDTTTTSSDTTTTTTTDNIPITTTTSDTSTTTSSTESSSTSSTTAVDTTTTSSDTTTTTTTDNIPITTTTSDTSTTTSSTESSSTSSTTAVDTTTTSSSTSSDTSSSTSTTTSSSTSTTSSSTSSSTTSDTSSSTSTTTSSSTSSSTSTTSSTTSRITTTSSSTSTTTIVITTTAVITTTTKSVIQGSSDISIKTLFPNILTSYDSVRIFSSEVTLNILGSNYDFYRIHPNGFISLGYSASLSLPDPTFSISNFNFPIISPFWTSSVFDQNSDILSGRYDAKNMDANLLNSVRTLIRQSSNSVSRAVSASDYSPELIIAITWKDLKPSTASTERITFQLFLTISYSQETSFAIFNYQFSNWTTSSIRSKNVFIGYTDGSQRRITNRFSRNSDSNGNPSQIVNQIGNTNILGAFVYEMPYRTLDACTLWYNKKILSDYQIPNTRNPFFPCPLTDNGIEFNPYYRRLNSPLLWQEANCYALKSNAFFRRYLQQVCCFDKDFGDLIFTGPDSGFVYNSNDLTSILREGSPCCSDNNWRNCRKFYQLYPQTVLTRAQQRIIFGWGGGDPHLTTYDNYTYTFNGFGQFILSKAIDNSFEIQAKTDVLENVNGSSSLSGTTFSSFAMRTNVSSIFHIELVDSQTPNPYFALYINTSNVAQSDFSRNSNYFKEFPCIDDPSSTCTTIIQSFVNQAFTCQFIFNNGLSITFIISTAKIDQFQSRSWITSSITFFESTVYNYTNSLVGLMGNNNGDPSDDLKFRNGTLAPSNSERQIYNAAVTWRLTSSDTIFFAQNTPTVNSRIKIPRLVEDYTPPFLDEIPVDNNIKISCNSNPACIFDAMASGILSIGKDTVQGIKTNQLAILETSKVPPIIIFRNNTVQIDWSNPAQITIIADITDTNSFTFNITVKNVTTYTTNTASSSGFNQVVTIRFTPKLNEYPSIEIIATDETSLTKSVVLSNILICNCKSADSLSQCDYNNIQLVVNPEISVVACTCSQYYTGTYCENIKNDCNLGNFCNLYANLNMSTCSPLTVPEQIATGRTYKCTGTCLAGYSNANNVYGACEDIDECTTGPCPSSATCINQLGSYTCNCGIGYLFRNNSCQMINYCNTGLNTCDSICNNILGGVNCSCYDGFTLQGSSTCVKTSVDNRCDTFGCSPSGIGFCIINSATNNPECRCRNGYKLDSDAKTCIDINECTEVANVCPETCANSIGSFECTCKNGSLFDATLQQCQTCPSNTFGFKCSQTCNCGPNSLRCDPVSGCVCNSGYIGSDCNTINDPCNARNLTANQICINRAGVAEIQCENGYKLDPLTNQCKLIDVCSPDPCPKIPVNSTCSKPSNFTYICNCPTGTIYNQNTLNCDDVNECNNNRNICPASSSCLNIQYNGYRCTCNSGYFDNNNGANQTNPVCIDIDECKLGISTCDTLTQDCVNTPGSFNCPCKNGFISIPGSNTCIQTTTSTTTTTTTTTPFYNNTAFAMVTAAPKDNTGLILVIVLPIIAVLILSIIAGSICVCWYKMRASNRAINTPKSGQFTSQGLATNQGQVQSQNVTQTNTGQSMFIKSSEPDLIDFNDIGTEIIDQDDRNDQSIFEDGSPTTSHSIYRANYPFENKSYSNDDFFKSLEENARTNQKTTITRPQSVFTDSSFSLPTGYYEQTTPYGDYNNDKKNKFKKGSNNNLQSDFKDDDDESFNAFENDDDLDDIIEAFNPNVQIPRPKIQINPLKIFKFGGKNNESEDS